MTPKPEERQRDRVLVVGRPNYERCDNTIITSRYTLITFLPVAILEQFRRFANQYFLVVGCIMGVGYYAPSLFESAISPWTTLGPLGFVISISLLVEGFADLKRHKNDYETNSAPCVVVRNAEELDGERHPSEKSSDNAEHGMGAREPSILNGRDVVVNLAKPYHSNLETPMASGQNPNSVRVAFERVCRKDIRQGHIVLVKNREMVPADIIILASSSDNGSAYIETSSIDGETNLKLRTSPHLPKSILRQLRDKSLDTLPEDEDFSGEEDENDPHIHETLQQATKRITRLSALANPHGVSTLEHPNYVPGETDENLEPEHRRSSLLSMVKGIGSHVIDNVHIPSSSSRFIVTENAAAQETNKYLAALTSEPPNPHVNTFTGKLTFPPLLQDGVPVGSCIDVPLGAENILLRGAVIRNTEWVLGVACFTGTDTKLVQNSVKPPSKFSRLDKLMNRTVAIIILVMILCISYLASQAVVHGNRDFDTLWYLGYSKNVDQPWPYLQDLPPPAWETTTRNWAQLFFLYVTLLNNFVPLSLYVTVEIITFCMLAFIYVDLDMYDDTTDTRAVARSTIVTDLGQVQYIFSDKTGTLTQNVMRFKRCSVDGLVFGAPIQRSRPGAPEETADPQSNTPFHPLRQLLVGRVSFAEQPSRGSLMRHPSPGLLAGLERYGVEVSTDDAFGKKLTFNAEMFLRVMGLCHTVVVEKDLDQQITIDSEKTVNSSGSPWSNRASLVAKKVFGKRSSAEMRSSAVPRMIGSPLPAVAEEGDYPEDFSKHSGSGNRSRFDSSGSAVSNAGSVNGGSGMKMPMEKNDDGAPMGYAYQAESPDEGALVSAASEKFGFQVIGRDSTGIKLRCSSASHLLDGRIVQGLKDGSLTLKGLAADTAAEPLQSGQAEPPETSEDNERYETWSILAVNKFDSDRKRMSVLLRSPMEMGEMPILFCKGADSAMLDPSVCSGAHALLSGDEQPEDIARKSMEGRFPGVPTVVGEKGVTTNGRLSVDSALDTEDHDEWEMAQMLGIQAHLGDFASEGLRTLVLGMRILTEEECTEWLEKYKEAATSIKNREEKLKEAALAIERDLHIVGATAIEDKLQKGVPDSIATLGKAGIKLWVLTGDKRETAIEIGYSTHVLTPKMHLTEAADKGETFVRTQMAMEFIRLVKLGKLPLYQRTVVDKAEKGYSWENFWFKFGKFRRAISRSIRRSWMKCSKVLCSRDAKHVEFVLQEIDEEAAAEEHILKDTERRRRVRNRAEKIIRDFLSSPEGQLQRSRRLHSRPSSPMASSAFSDQDDVEELTLTSDDLPSVFNRAQSARHLLNRRRSQGRLSQSERRTLAIAQLTAQEISGGTPLVDEDTLSLNSFFVGDKNAASDFDKRKRTLLERLFAVDKEVRKGRLRKHLRKDKLAAIAEAEGEQREADQHDDSPEQQTASEGPRALVVEGAALKHLLGDPELEEIIFSVASSCDAVIACRVSPKQKALLVHLVRHHVVPEPVTLAIGDGANDVGMIQEAHVGVGISGKEGKQAVNSSDFAIAQFRFLEDLLLIHGRWNFFRMSTVVMFSFYKNAVMAGCLIAYTAQTLYSGTPLFDQWVIAMLNFVAGIPIIVLGLFDRCLDKSYIRRHPEVYKPTRTNELITIRTQVRWILLVFAHLFTIYYMTVPTLALNGGGISSAFMGLMRNKYRDSPGDGEGGDLKSVGTVTFTCLIILLAYKVLYESRSLIHGKWPAFTFRSGVGEGFTSRLAYTWIGVTYCSIAFYLIFLAIYQTLGRSGAGTFSEFVDTSNHVLATRSIHWMLIMFVPIFAMAFDVCAKVFSNMFYPTQTQIHIELEAMEKRNRRLGIGERNFRLRPSVTHA